MSIKINEGLYFICDKCSVCDGVDAVLKTIEKYGVYGYFDTGYCWYDKVGCKNFAFGDCGDAFIKAISTKGIRPLPDLKMRTRLRRENRKKKKDKRMKIIGLDRYNPCAGYVEYGYVNGEWSPVGTYIKYPRRLNKRKHYIKRQANKAARRKCLSNGGGYKKVYDYRSMLY